MADVNRTVDIIFKGKDQLGPTVSTIEKSIGGIGEEAADSQGKVDNLGKEVDTLGGKPKKSVDALSAAFKALAASLIIKDFIAANVAFESFNRTMVLVTGSTEQAADEFEYLTDLSNQLGLEVIATAKSYANLAAATKGTNLAGQDTREIFEAVSIAMSSLGKTTADTDGALQAITQIVSKGTVSMEELRQQLGERLPGAMQIAAQSLGLTTEELDDLVSKGNLAATDFLPKFAAALKDAFGDVAFVDTYTASLNRLKNAVTEAELQLGEAGGFDALTKIVQGGTAAIVGAISAFEVLGTVAGAVIAAIVNWDFSDVGRTIDEAMQGAADNTRQARDAFLGLQDSAEAVDKTLADVGGRVEGELWVLEPVTRYAEEVEEVSKNADKARISLEQIASNERIKNIEARIDLNIAEIEADAKVAVSIVEALASSITVTGDLLGSLFGDLSEASSFREQFQIEDQIALENERRQEQLDLQNRLTAAQIRSINLQNERLRNGNPLITVNGDGLQPHLEAFMWEVLDAIQVRVNEDGLDFLLGAA